MDATEALEPRAVDEILLGRLSRRAAGAALRDAKVSIYGIAGQVDA